nr:FprA family A-type flavoprotein [bacterium]
NGIKADLFNLQFNHISDIMTELLTAKYVCVGSPTLNNNILPTTSAFLTYLKGLSPKNRTGLAFGSYGWGGQSVGIIEEQLKLCGFELLPSIKIQYVPDEKFLDEIEIKL